MIYGIFLNSGVLGSLLLVPTKNKSAALHLKLSWPRIVEQHLVASTTTVSSSGHTELTQHLQGESRNPQATGVGKRASRS